MRKSTTIMRSRPAALVAATPNQVDDLLWIGAVLYAHNARDAWRKLPGPWWVKTLIVVVCVAIPGPGDEIAVLALAGAAAARKARASRARHAMETGN
jgi:hypothetical protein